MPSSHTRLHTRQLTVYRSNGVYWQRPKIRLQGRWLADAGFLPGDAIKVEVRKGRLIITKTLPS